jgi:hypothetical protein
MKLKSDLKSLSAEVASRNIALEEKFTVQFTALSAKVDKILDFLNQLQE